MPPFQISLKVVLREQVAILRYDNLMSDYAIEKVQKIMAETRTKKQHDLPKHYHTDIDDEPNRRKK